MNTNPEVKEFSAAAVSASTAAVGFMQLQALFGAIEKFAPAEGEVARLAQVGSVLADGFIRIADRSLTAELLRTAPRPKRPRQRPKAKVVPIATDTKKD